MISHEVAAQMILAAQPEDLARAVALANQERWQAILDSVEDALWEEFDRLSDRVCDWCGFSMESGSLRCWTHETCRCATLGRMECFIHNPPEVRA